MKSHRVYKRLSTKCGLRHTKPTGLKCLRHSSNMSWPGSTSDLNMDALGSTNPVTSTAATTSTTVTTTVSCGTTVSSAATTVTTASHALAASPSVGSTLQTLVTAIAAMSARMDAMETAIHTQAAAPQPVAPPAPVLPQLQVPQPEMPPITVPLAPSHLPEPQQPSTSRTMPPPPPLAGPVGQQAAAASELLRPAVSGPAARVQQELMAAIGEYSSSDSDDNYHPQASRSKSRRLKSGRSRTSEDVVKRHVDWPHFNVFKGPSRAAAEFDSLTIPEFVYGYMGNVLKPDISSSDQVAMLRHLRELMHDATMFPWEGVRNFHGILLRLMEHDEATWKDRALIQELRAQYSRTPAASYRSSQAASSRPRPRSRPCPDFQKGACTHTDDHDSHQGGLVSHICGWCYRVRRKSYQHPEKDCFTKKKRESKNGGTDSEG